jgi:hypothetical protein
VRYLTKFPTGLRAAFRWIRIVRSRQLFQVPS